MNTPAHVVFNWLVLARRSERPRVIPVLLGAVLPDLPMVGFYLFEKLIRGQSEQLIWNQTYFEPAWQALFDSFHSLPLLALAFAILRKAGYPRLTLVFTSMMLHSLCDLPLHHDDAHRHFFPLSDWRFESPLSYWDPSHYGGFTAPLEAVFVLVGCFVLARRARTPLAWIMAGGLGAVYVVYLAHAVLFWT